MVPSVSGHRLATLVIVASCGGTEPDVPDVLGFSVDASVSQTEVEVGDTAWVRVVARNNTDRVLSFDHNACRSVYVVSDSLGHVLFGRPRTCNDIGLRTEVAPGASVTDSLVFDGRGPGIGPGSSEVTLPASRYLIRAGLSGGSLMPDPPMEVRVRARP